MDKENFTSEDLQRTMEVPVTGGKKDIDGGIYDPWHLDSQGPPEKILNSIAKSLSERENKNGIITVPVIPPAEETAEEIAPRPEMQPVTEPEEKTDDTIVLPAVSEHKEKAEPAIDATMVVPVTPAPEKEENSVSDATMAVPQVAPQPEQEILPEKEIMRQKASGGRIWPPVLISSIFMVIACCITLVIGLLPVLTEHGFAGGMTQIIAPVINVSEPPAYTNVLLVGVDEDGYRTDTMMVATYDVENKKVSVMQLPRDTYVANNGRTDKKLNSAYYSGMKQLQREIQIAYGIEIHKYVGINLEAFRLMIDAIGGVEMNVPINMIYDDPTQDFHIYLLKGVQVLDGKKAEQFVRFRKNNDGSGYPRGDLQRMEAQKEFIMATVRQMISIDGLKNINELIKIAQENVDTDLTFDEIYSYCTSVLTAEEGSIEFIEAPGDAMTLPFGSYFIVDYDGARKIAQNHFYATQATMAKMTRVVVEPVVPEETEPEEEPEEEEDAPGAVQRPSRPESGSSAATRPDEDEPETETSEGDDLGSGAMSR